MISNILRILRVGANPALNDIQEAYIRKMEALPNEQITPEQLTIACSMLKTTRERIDEIQEKLNEYEQIPEHILLQMIKQECHKNLDELGNKNN